MIRTLLVDDEQPARERLRQLLALRDTLPNLNIGIHSVVSVFSVGHLDELIAYAEQSGADQFITEIAEPRVELDTVGLPITPSPEQYRAAIIAGTGTNDTAHTIEREYLCVAHGQTPPELRIESRLVKDRGDGLRDEFRVGEGGKLHQPDTLRELIGNVSGPAISGWAPPRTSRARAPRFVRRGSRRVERR